MIQSGPIFNKKPKKEIQLGSHRPAQALGPHKTIYARVPLAKTYPTR